MWGKKFWKIIAAGIIVIISLGSFAGCSSKTATSLATQKATVTRGKISNEITATGNLSMPNQAKLTFGASGTVDQIMVNIGDSVTTGQILAKLDSVTVSTLKQSLLKAQINVKQAQMDLDNAKTPTLSSGSSTVTAPDPLDIEAKELSLQSARISLDSAQKQLDGATLIAPFDSQVAAVNVLVGDKISSGTVAIRLIDPTQLEVDTLVNEMDIFNVNPGALATIQVTATGTSLVASVAAISPSASTSGGVVNYTVQLKVNTAKRAAGSLAQAGSTANSTAQASDPVILKEGLSVNISLVIQQKENVLLVLSRALNKVNGNSVAQVLKTNGTTEQRTVQTGISDWQNTEITSGLNEGEVLLINTATSSTSKTSSGDMGPPPGDMGGGGPPPP
jgi:RND family efflux transporter MFP subunit